MNVRMTNKGYKSMKIIVRRVNKWRTGRAGEGNSESKDTSKLIQN